MLCPWCNYGNVASAGFCGGCGRPLEFDAVCPACSSANPSANRYCDACGARLAGSVEQGGTPALSEVASPGRQAVLSGREAHEKEIGLQSGLRQWAGRRLADLNDLPWPHRWRRLEPLVDILAGRRSQGLGLRWPAIERGLFSRAWHGELLLVALLGAVALAVRVYMLEDIPPGFHGDEGAFAIEAEKVARGQLLGLWTPVTLGHATGHIYWTALLFKIGSPSVFTTRLAMALLGALTVPAAYLLFRELFSSRIAFLGAGLIAFSSWHLIYSRAGWTIVPAVLVVLLGLYLLFRGWRSGRSMDFIVGGILLGIGFYTHKNFPFYYAGVWAFVLLRLYLGASQKVRRGGWLFLLTSLLVASPFLIFMLANYEIFTGRLAVESFFNRAPFETAEGLNEKAGAVVGRVAEVLLYVHNAVPRDYVDAAGGRPLLDRASEAFFWLGLLVAIVRIRRPAYLLVVVGLVAGSLPPMLVVTGEERRLLGAMPFVMACVALGLDTAIQVLLLSMARLERLVRWPRAYDALRTGSATLAVAGFLAFFSFTNLTYYFDEWASDPTVKWVYVYDLVQVVDYLKTLDEDTYVYFYSHRWSYDYETRRFLLPRMKGEDRSKEFAGVVDLKRDRSGKVTYVLVRGYSDLAPLVKDLYPGGRYEEVRDSDGSLVFAAYTPTQ